MALCKTCVDIMKTRQPKQQFNVRMRPELRQAALNLCDAAQLTRDDLSETLYVRVD
jgi:hypothetical protein